MDLEKNKHRPTFYEIFENALNNKSNSRPPKMELKGILVPCYKVYRGETYHFKLKTDSRDYILILNETLMPLAKRAAWEEVTAKGYLDFESGFFEVEKFNLVENGEFKWGGAVALLRRSPATI